eukprot:jgi/Chrzof1/9317/UNPLg00286.t1
MITNRVLLYTATVSTASLLSAVLHCTCPWLSLGLFRKPISNADGTPTEQREYLSADAVVEGEQEGTYPTEFLNSLSFSGVPPQQFLLQVGFRHLIAQHDKGLANGTRLIVTKLMPHVSEAEVATGPDKSKRVCIPRLSITPCDIEKKPFTLRRRQFPLRPAFAMTINKSQGQSMKMVGVYLPKPMFSHGQLYVAFSRVGSKQHVKVLVQNGWYLHQQCGV